MDPSEHEHWTHTFLLWIMLINCVDKNHTEHKKNEEKETERHTENTEKKKRAMHMRYKRVSTMPYPCMVLTDVAQIIYLLHTKYQITTVAKCFGNNSRPECQM